MVQINRKFKGAQWLVLLTLFAVLCSFSGNWGGDSYKVFVNNKLVMEEYVHGQKGVKALQLNPRGVNDEISVYYSHCGSWGKARNITLKDGKNKILKEWKFDDATGTGAKAAMVCSAKDILDAKKNGGYDRLNLYYSSKELPQGKLLVYIITAKDNVTAP
ncbi:MAG TPA: hypothetical protein VD993_03695 [Chitinophagaceae bacterium]|nr:hypothetical protein [Chitinophagaceae bacterium]